MSPHSKSPSTNRRSSDKQREHQANERTYLAWLRTSISLIGFGFAIARFGIFLQQLDQTQAAVGNPFFSSRLIGISLVGFGIFSIILAAWRYNQAFLQIERGHYKPNRGVIWLLSAMVTALGLLCIPLLF
ncbi:MAG: DUF202 domain-containing protein [Cyanobacteria bacterium J06621_11]